MGKSNAAVKQWLERKDRFADLFNGYIFQGKQVILPEELEPADGERDILLMDKNEKVQEVHRYRDIIMRWKKGAFFVMLACENQDKIHYAMAVRNMLYDSLSYVGQIQQKWENHNQDEKVTREEFLSKFRKEDKLIPVITLVFYYGTEKWDGSTDLYGLLRLGKEPMSETIKNYVSNYHINLIDANDIENIERFHTDLQEILGMLKCRGNKNELLEYINKRKTYFRNVDEETYHMLRVMLNSEKMLKETVEGKKGEEGVDMCKALEDLYNDGIECGLERGIEQGLERGIEQGLERGIEQGLERGLERGLVQGTIETMREFGAKKEEVVNKIMSKFQISEEAAEKAVQEYWG